MKHLLVSVSLSFLVIVGNTNAQSFLYTDFENDDAWEIGSAKSGTREVTQNGYQFTLPGLEPADMSSGLSATADDGIHDYSVRARINLEQAGPGTFVGITARSFKGRPANDRESVFSVFTPDGQLLFGWGNSAGVPTVIETADLGFSTVSKDVFLQVDMIGDHFQVTAWSPDNRKPGAQVSRELVRPHNGGGIALLLSSAGAATATFKSFESRPPGDANGDFVVDVKDIDLITNMVNGREGESDSSWSDLDGDGLLSNSDRDFWVIDISNTYFGDANLDGEFDSSDFVSVFALGKYETEAIAGWASGDWNGDRVFDSGDLVTAFQVGGYEQGPKEAVNAVPEPNGVVRLLVALAGFFIYRRH